MPNQQYWANRGKRIRAYGITIQEHNRLRDEQGNVCAICGGVNKDQALCIDHDHATGEVRGLLCHACNRAIGLLKDDPELMVRAAEYIRKGVPDYIKGKLITQHGKKVRVALDYEVPEVVYEEYTEERMKAEFTEMFSEEHKREFGHRLEDCKGAKVYNRAGVFMRIQH